MAWIVFREGAVVERGDDETRKVYDGAGQVIRPYTEAENTAADDRFVTASQLDDLEARVARIEAHLWPPDPAPSEGTTYPPFEGIWPAGTIIEDGGTLYRNVAGVPLTTPPSGFPGDPDEWTRLFVKVEAGEPAPTAPEWSPEATYKVDDPVVKDGVLYVCLIAHGPERQGTWAPPAEGVWQPT